VHGAAFEKPTPLLYFTASLSCCSAARHCGHSVQHFVG
jgi:hypothetical protein